MSDAAGQLDIGADAAWVAAALLLVACLGGAVVLAEWPLLGVTPEQPDEPTLVEPADDGTKLWPYTAKSTTYRSRTLGINMVVFGDPADVQTILAEETTFEWEDEQVHEGDADSDTVSGDRVEVDVDAENVSELIAWRPAEGSTRYVYVESDGTGRWIDESYQLHSGTYFGSRMHVRAYDDPNGEWTALQVHEEHWDWFRLRHTVTGLSDPRQEVERDFMRQPYVDSVARLPFQNPTGDSDGWATAVYLSGLLLPLVVGFIGRTREAKQQARRFLQRQRREISLGAALFALYVGIRYVAIGAEKLLPGLSPKLIAGPLYLALVFGVPAIAYVGGRESTRTWAFAFAGVGLGAALIVDLAAMGVSVLPLRVVLHRATLLLAVGLIALGSARRTPENRRPTPLLVGGAGWVLALGAPLFGYV
ncbi:MAG: hypothetical protein ACI8UR_000242 [Natronomonas sp.]|jgi:hypothetical protein|uniref:hypothetical protein n=1 Tax=Natronomonas sp. TaxID=2184060 RepID=UPI003988F819